MDNIIGTHISNVKKRLKKYNSLILKTKYNKVFSDELVQAYIDARYYNYNMDNKIRVFYRRIYNAIIEKGKELIKKEPRKKESIENHISLFQYYFYFDNVRDNIELEEIVDKIAEKRIFKFNLKSALKDNFKEEFLQIVKQDIKQSNEELDKCFSNEFDLEVKKINPDNNDYYRVKLRYYFDFPEIFSKESIEEVFNTDVISEDKLFVEYPMISVRVLNEILAGNFNKKYICDFSANLFKKKKKLEQLLQILDNQAAQDKIFFEIKYQEFLENKEEIFKLIKRGFSFALKTNSAMPKLLNEEINILEIFNCIIVDNNDINKTKYKNIKIIEK